MFETGQIVFSKAGRDKRLAFIIVSTEGDYVFLADGRLRSLEKPKKKKMKHIQPTNTIVNELKVKLDNNLYINNADIRKALLPIQNAEDNIFSRFCINDKEA